MLSSNVIDQAAQRLASVCTSPATVFVVGSYARGDASESSDLDLVVVQSEVRDKAAEYLRLKAAVGRVGVGVDLLLFSREEFDRRSLVPGTLPYWAKKEGRILYESAN